MAQTLKLEFFSHWNFRSNCHIKQKTFYSFENFQLCLALKQFKIIYGRAIKHMRMCNANLFSACVESTPILFYQKLSSVFKNLPILMRKSIKAHKQFGESR